MIAILIAHTAYSPNIVDNVLKKNKHFEGDHVYICGRWDADSDYIRKLLANGKSGIPIGRKHMFCHTSVQAICYCIGTVFGLRWGPGINIPSGLFMECCQFCGLKLQLLPLYILVIAGFHLSRSVCKDETLFGILACLLCLISKRANPLLKANICLQTPFRNEDTAGCSHEEIDPAELAERVQGNSESTRPKELCTGWRIICVVIRHSQSDWKGHKSMRRSALDEQEQHDDMFDAFILQSDEDPSDEEDASRDYRLPVECPCHCLHQNFFGGNKHLATVWAAVQTELLTYRRIQEGDMWMSANINMETLLESLVRGTEPAIGLVQMDMMRSFCEAGQFFDAVPECPIADDAIAYYFSNLEDWTRLSFIKCPDDRFDT